MIIRTILAWACALGLCVSADARPTRDRRANPVLSSGTAYSTPAVLDPAQLPGVRFWFAPWYTAHSWQESGETTTQLTHVTADAQAFGSWQDPVFGSQVWARSATRLGVSGTLNGRAYYECSSTSSNDELTIQDSQDLFRSFHVDRTGTIAMRIDPVTANGTAFTIYDNDALTGAQRGIWMQRTTGNRIQAAVTNGTTTICNHTTVGTVTSGGGSLTDVVVVYSAGAVSIYIGAAAAETFSCSGSGSAGSAGQEFAFCGASAGTGNTSMRIGELVISDTAWTSGQVAAWRALTTARTTTPIGCSASGTCPFLHTHYDFRDILSLWEDAGATNQVDGAADSIHIARDTRDVNNYLRRQAASVGATRPTYVSATDGIEFSGTTTQDLAWTGSWERGAARTTFMVATCDDLVLGCHLTYSAAAQYWVVTGTNYSGNVTTAYMLKHLPASSTVFDTTTTIATPGGRNCFVVQRDGSNWLGGAVGGNIEADTNSESDRPVNIGAEANAGWSMDGYVRGLRAYNTAVPQSEWAAICTAMGL